jgi:hypothetical protein
MITVLIDAFCRIRVSRSVWIAIVAANYSLEGALDRGHLALKQRSNESSATLLNQDFERRARSLLLSSLISAHVRVVIDGAIYNEFRIRIGSGVTNSLAQQEVDPNPISGPLAPLHPVSSFGSRQRRKHQ